jgi:hypothetical protein
MFGQHAVGADWLGDDPARALGPPAESDLNPVWSFAATLRTSPTSNLAYVSLKVVGPACPGTIFYPLVPPAGARASAAAAQWRRTDRALPQPRARARTPAAVARPRATLGSRLRQASAPPPAHPPPAATGPRGGRLWRRH